MYICMTVFSFARSLLFGRRADAQTPRGDQLSRRPIPLAHRVRGRGQLAAICGLQGLC